MIEKICPTCKHPFTVPFKNRKRIFCSRNCINRGRLHSQEWKDELALRNAGRGNPFFGKKHTINTIEALRQARLGKSWDDIMGKEKADDLRHRFSVMFSGSNNPFSGKHHTQDSRDLITLNHLCMSGSNNPMYGRGDKIRGEKNGAWRGGLNVDPYHGSFTQELKTEIRQRDRFTCKICGKNGFVIHHIDYDKMNNAATNLVALCRSCHGKTNFNREAWIRFFNG